MFLEIEHLEHISAESQPPMSVLFHYVIELLLGICGRRADIYKERTYAVASTGLAAKASM